MLKYPCLILILFTLSSYFLLSSCGSSSVETKNPTGMNIKMTSVFVPNPSEAFKFYTEILGFDSLMHMPEASLAIVVAKGDPKGTALLLEPNGNPVAKTYQEGIYNLGLPVIVFGTSDMDAEFKRLSELGVNFKQEPTKTEWGTIAVFDDGFGNFIQIHQD